MYKAAWRFFIRGALAHRSYALLNVLGLAVGLAVTLLVILYLKTELTYDSHVPQNDRVYRLTSQFYFDREYHHFAPTGVGLGPLMMEESDDIETYVRIGSAGKNVLLSRGDESYYEDLIFYADSNYFEIFPATFLEGDPNTALSQSNGMVLTQSLAQRIFKGEPAMGQWLRTNNNRFMVTGIIEDLPQNAHVQFKALLPAFVSDMSREEVIRSLWAASTFTYVKVKPEAGQEELFTAFRRVYATHMADVAEVIQSDYTIIIEPLRDVHYKSLARFDLPQGQTEYLYVFTGVGLLILALAIINYMNLTTARASSRAKEIALRKVMGSTRRDVVLQLLVESILFTALALLVSVVMVELALRSEYLHKLIQKQLYLDVLLEPTMFLAAFAAVILVGIIAGIYPALYLSRVKVISALKGVFKVGPRSVRLRNFLVGLQFTFSISVVVLAVLMNRQMDFLGDQYLGFNKEDIVLIPVQDTSLQASFPRLIAEVSKQKHVVSVSSAEAVVGQNIPRMLMMAQSSALRSNVREAIDFMNVGVDYFTTMEIDFLLGGTFQTERHTDTSQTVVVNRALVDYYGWENPIGQVLEWGLRESGHSTYTGTVVGVVDNFNASSLHHEVEPMILFYDKGMLGTLHVRVDSRHLKSALAELEEVWDQFETGRSFEFSFLDLDLDNLYSEDDRQARLIFLLTFVTILISTMGLLGLSSFTTQRRYREIGIRKVLGASVANIVSLLFKDIALLVALGVLISIPLSWSVFRIWTDHFAYSAPIEHFVFLTIGLGAVLFSYVVVSFHSIRASRVNPVEVIKYE